MRRRVDIFSKRDATIIIVGAFSVAAAVGAAGGVLIGRRWR